MKTLRIDGKAIGNFSVYRSGGECIDYAASELCAYVKRAFGVSLDATGKRTSDQIVLETDNRAERDGFTLACRGGEFFIEGGSERAVLYGVYAFLEKFVGWRFFAGASCYKGEEAAPYLAPVEKLFEQEADEVVDGYEYTTAPIITFRDAFGHATVDESWCAKNRINGDIWKLKNVPAHMGGADTFATDGGHSFSKLIPKEKYFATHPEWFSLLNGERVAGETSQLCLTADGLAEEVAANVIAIADAHPGAKYVSVSQNDNNDFCTCERCRAEEARVGRGNLLFKFINEVARLVYAVRPDIMIHTYAYESTIQDDPIRLEKNVTVQYCLRYCRCHALTDPNCKGNVAVVKRLQKLSKLCKELFIYDYTSSEAFVPLALPDLFRMKENMRFLADVGVSGIYSENDIFCQNSPCAEELRNYLYARVTWNPYMSDAEFNRHIDEFLRGYYGDGWRYIRRFFELYDEESRSSHIDSTSGRNVDDEGNLIVENGKNVRCVTIPIDRIAEVIPELEKLLDLASAEADENGKNRIKMLRAFTLWYRLYHTMEGIMENGTDEEKAKAVADNRELCSILRRYCMKYTVFIAMTETTAMFKDFTLPPSKWNYWTIGDKPRYGRLF